MFGNDCITSGFTFFCDNVLSTIYKKKKKLETLNWNNEFYGRHHSKEEHTPTHLHFKSLPSYLV